MVGGLFKFLFGGGRNAIAETAEVFRVNAERQAARTMDLDAASLAQYAAEFHNRQNRNWVDAFADALNRLVRPVLTVAIFVPLLMTILDTASMVEFWAAIATLPTEYWALLGVVISFYFGGRMQVKALGMRKGAQAAATAAAAVVERRRELAPPAQTDVIEGDPPIIEAMKPAVAEGPDIELQPTVSRTGNAAIDEWLKT